MKKSNVSHKRKDYTRKPREQRYPLRVTTNVKPEWIVGSEYHKDGISGFIRDAIVAYKDHFLLWDFQRILEDISKQILILYRWKEKGRPDRLKWTDREEEMLTYYERCFEILENSPFNKRLK